jgi:hypothetical protein
MGLSLPSFQELLTEQMKPVLVVGKAKRHNHFIDQIFGQLLLLSLKKPITVMEDVMNGRTQVK